MTIAEIGVVIPARNEEVLLPACLDALELAIAAVAPVPVTVVVVLDACTDASADVVAARPWAQPLSIEACNVGRARRAGAAEILDRYQGGALDDLWLANTDADSTVPSDWLSGQLKLAADGWEVVVGTVAVEDWSDHQASVPDSWRAGYRATEQHPHIHGANLSFTAAAYVDVDGWPTLPVHEDAALIKRLAARGVVSTATLPVVTSARRDPRAAGGFGDTLSTLAG
jgi:glycosyltransferase involved in cell wall biosynthesis